MPSQILHDFLARSQNGNATLRQLTNEETEIVLDLRKIKKSANLCMTEMMFVKEVIKRLNITDLYWVVMNFERIIHSVYRQRNMAHAVFAAVSHTQPSDEEKKSIHYFISSFEKRISYINEVPIPENIKLTPIQDYMDIVGASNFLEEIRTLLPTGKDIFDARTNGTMDNLISHMMQTLSDAGKDRLYKKRLDEYVDIIRKRAEKDRAERLEERNRKRKSESENGIAVFKELFCKCVRNMNSEKKINLSENAIRSHLNAGHRGMLCILSCGYINGKYSYKYVSDDQRLINRFGDVSLFGTIDEANKAILTLQSIYPTNSFLPIAI